MKPTWATGKDVTLETSSETPSTVGELDERALIARIQRRLPPAPDWTLVGIGDDAAVVEPARNRAEVLSVDAFVEGVHFDRLFTPPDAIGHRALAANLSDLAAMGAEPRLALLSFVLPSQLTLAEFDGTVGGLLRLAAAHRLHVAGGNLTRSPGSLVIDITVMGTVKRRQALVRGGARPGDAIYVSGTIGAAAAGLQMLRAGTGRAQPIEAGSHTCTQRYLYPEPRVRLGLLLSRNRAASACIDLSDGLSDGLYRIAEASGVGMAIEPGLLPADPAARAWFGACGLDALTETIAAGDDYELLFTVRPAARRRFIAAARHGGVPLTRIGICTKERAMVLRSPSDSPAVERELPRVGYDHFR